MIVTVLRRGGLAVFGGSYDPRRDEAVADLGTEQRVVVVFPQDIEDPQLQADGIIATDLTAKENRVSFTASGAGNITLTARMGEGRPAVRIVMPRGQSRDYAG